MARGTGLPIPKSGEIIDPRISVVRAEVFSSAEVWEGVKRIGGQVTDTALDFHEILVKRQQAGRIAGEELEIDREETELREGHRFDPAGFDKAWVAYSDGKLSEAEPWLVPHLKQYLGKRGNQAYRGLLAEKADRGAQLAAETLKTRLRAADEEIIGLAEANKIETPEFGEAIAMYDGVLRAGAETFVWSQEQADLDRADVNARAQGTAAALKAMEVQGEQGYGAAVTHLRTNVLESDALGLSQAQRTKIFNHGLKRLNLRQQETRIERESAASRARDLRDRIKDAPGLLDTGEVQEVLGELKLYGLAGEYHRLAKQAAVAEAVAPFHDGSVPLGDFARHVENLRGEVGMDVPPNLRPVLDEAARETSVAPSFMYRLAQKESGFNAAATSSTSSAAGLMQFTDSTWRAMLEKHGARFGLSPSTPKSDPRASALMSGMLAQENANVLEEAKIALTPGNLYVAHFAGAEGAVKLLKADPNASAADILPDAAKANRSIFYDRSGRARSVGEMLGSLTQGFEGITGLPSSGDVTREVQRLFVENAKKFWPEFQKGIERGQTPSADDLRAVGYAASLSGDQKWVAEVNAAMTAAGVAPIMAGGPAAQTKAEIERVREQYAEGGWTISETETFRLIEGQFKQQQEILAEDPVTFAVRSLNQRAPDPLNFVDRNAMREGLKQRAALTRRVADAQGVPVGDPLGPIERKAFEAALASADPAGKAAIYSDLVDSLPQDQLAVVLGNLGSKGPDAMVSAWAGALMAQDAAVASSIIRGQSAGKADKRFNPSDADSTAANEALDELLPASAFSLPARTNETGAYATVKGAVWARYADLAAQSGDTSGKVNEDRLQQAVEDVTGGLVDLNGGKLIAPFRGMRQEEFDETMSEITDDELSTAGTLSGARLSAEYLRESARLESIGDGRYLIQVGVDPAAPIYAVDLGRDPPVPFVLDLRARELRNVQRPFLLPVLQ